MQRFGGFFQAQSPEEPQLDHLALSLVVFREFLQRIVEGNQVATRIVGDRQVVNQCHPHRAAAALLRAFGAREVDEDPPHQTRGHGEEMRPVLPADASAFDEAQIDFVDERGRLEAVPGVLSRHLATSDPMQLVVDDRDQPVECRVIALSPCDEESRDVRRGCRDAGILPVELREFQRGLGTWRSPARSRAA